MRAVPGILYIPGEGWMGYSSRYRRLVVGLQALEPFELALRQLEDSLAKGNALSPQWPGLLKTSASTLAEISTIPCFEALKAEMTGELEREEGKMEKLQAELRELRNRRRFTEASQLKALDIKVKELEASEKVLVAQVEALRRRVEARITPLSTICELVASTQKAIEALAVKDIHDTEAYPALLASLKALHPSFRMMDASWTRYLCGDADWKRWLGPLFNWLVLIFLGYLVFMTFNTLIYRQWAHHEKLIYPIAEVTCMLAADGSQPSDRGPPLFKSGLFWFGFFLAVGILGWNYMATSAVIPNIRAIKLESWGHDYIGAGILEGAKHTRFVFIFAIVGLAFLVPANISFSSWLFQLLSVCVYIVMAWLGLGVGRQTVGNHPHLAMGGGGMLVFGLVTLWTCRHFLLCAFRPKVLQNLAEDERKELRISSWAFLASVLTLVMMLTLRFEVNLFHTILYLIMALILTIAMIRSVAEGGILGLESGFGCFDFVTKVIGTSKAWCAPQLFAPLVVYNTMIIGSLQAFIAPGMANALKIREKMRVRRLSFHGAIWTGILVSVVVSVVTLIILSYDVGANSLHEWLQGKDGKAPGISELIASPTTGDSKESPWVIAGAILMVFLLVARRSFFWIPHPIGLVLCVNPVMIGFWASILIGWVAKSIVGKYCSEAQYLVIRTFFVGLVVGHLFAVLCGWDMMKWHFG